MHSGQKVPTDVEIDRPPLRNQRHAFAFLWAGVSVVLFILGVQTVAGPELIEIAAVFFLMTHGPILPGDHRRGERGTPEEFVAPLSGKP